MKTDIRVRRADAVCALQKAHGQGLYTALTDLLEAELAEAQEEMESAGDDITIWRAQGRAAGARNLLAAITPRNAG